jgi:hypothetical protein
MELTMRKVLSLVAVAALLASGGVANAKGPDKTLLRTAGHGLPIEAVKAQEAQGPTGSEEPDEDEDQGSSQGHG